MEPRYVLFGAGRTGMAAVNYFGKDKIVAVIDNYPDKIGTLFEGVPVISFSEYLEKYKDLQVIVSIYTKLYFDAKDQLETNGIYNYFTAPPVICGFEAPEELAEQFMMEKNEKILFYDVNPISVRMYEWIKKNYGTECYFIKALKEKEKSGYEEQYPFVSIEDLSEKDTVVITTNEAEEHIRDILKKYFHGRIYDIYNCRPSKYSTLAAYKNRYQGQRCFIIGNGPSLCVSDLEKLKDFKEICFGSNRIYRIYEQTKWRPAYYVAIDTMGMKKPDMDFLHQHADASFFIADYYYADIDKIENATGFRMINRIYSNNENIYFSNDITEGVASGRTVTYAMLQLACYMGFTEIYLLGVDFSWGEDGRDTHFCKDYSNADEDKIQRTQAIRNKAEIERAYRSAQNYAKQHNIKIYNATRGGHLEVFERIDFDSLF